MSEVQVLVTVQVNSRDPQVAFTTEAVQAAGVRAVQSIVQYGERHGFAIVHDLPGEVTATVIGITAAEDSASPVDGNGAAASLSLLNALQRLSAVEPDLPWLSIMPGGRVLLKAVSENGSYVDRGTAAEAIEMFLQTQPSASTLFKNETVLRDALYNLHPRAGDNYGYAKGVLVGLLSLRRAYVDEVWTETERFFLPFMPTQVALESFPEGWFRSFYRKTADCYEKITESERPRA